MKVFIIAMLLGLVGCAKDTHQPQLFGFKQNVIVKSGFYKGMEGMVIGTWETDQCIAVFTGSCYITVYRLMMYDNVLKDNMSFRQDDLEATKE